MINIDFKWYRSSKEGEIVVSGSIWRRRWGLGVDIEDKVEFIWVVEKKGIKDKMIEIYIVILRDIRLISFFRVRIMR